MAGDRTLALLIDIRASNYTAGVIAQLIGGFSSAQKVLLGLALAAAGFAVAIGVMAVTAAGNFQQGLQRLVTGAGDVTDNMKAMGQAILGISTDTGVLSGPLLLAMYQVLSFGQRGAQALNTLSVAARGAVIEQANIVDVVKAVAGSMKDYGTAQFNATQFMNGFIRAVSLGRINLEELTTTMGPLIPLAAQYHVSFADLSAAMATMTNALIPAARAATSLRFLLQNLENPTLKEAKAMQAMGLSSVAVANEMKISLPKALQMVWDAAKKAGPEGSVPFNRAISDMIGGQRSLQAYLALTGRHFKEFTSDSKAITAAMNGSKTAVSGWALAQQNFNVVMSRANAAWHAFLIVLGTELIPIVLKVWDGFNHLVQIGGQVVSFFQKNQLASDALKAVIIGLAVALGVAAAVAIPAIVTAFIAWAIAAGAAAIATLAAIWPFLLIGIVVALVVFGIILAVRHWAEITKWFQGVWNTIWDAVSTAFVHIWNGIKIAALEGVRGILYLLSLIPGPIGDMAKSAMKSIDQMVASINASTDTMKVHVVHNMHDMRTLSVQHAQDMHHGVAQAAQDMSNQVVGHSIIPDMVNAIIRWFQKLVDMAKSWGSGIINNFLAGLQAAWNSVVAWVTGALAWLASKFPHSPVKEGPLKGSENWGYNFGMNLADGMRRSLPAIQSASLLLASAMGGSEQGSYSLSGGYGGARYPTGAAPVIVNVNNTYLPPSIKLDGAEVTDRIGRRMMKEIRVQGHIRNR